MSKWEDYKRAIKNPKPELLMQVEYRSHFMQIFGVAIVSVILVLKGFWYILFAFIFSIGVSYSQGMAAYKKYNSYMSYMENQPTEEDPSPSRRRSKVVQKVFGGASTMWASGLAVISAYVLIDPFRAPWYVQLAYFMLMLIFYVIFYYFILYWFAKRFDTKRYKEVKEDGERKRRRGKDSGRRSIKHRARKKVIRTKA